VSAVHPAAVHGPAALAARSAGRLVGAAGLLLFAVATGVILSKHPLPLTAVLAFGLGLLGTLALALGRYDTAVALGIFLLAAVRIEPAPADLILFVVIAVALVTGRFDLRRVPLVVIMLLSVFLALNMLASVELIDLGRGVTFFAITLYLAVFGLWLTSYVRSAFRARVVLRAYVAAAVLSAAVAVLALFVAFPGHDFFVRGPRAQGLFKDPNVLGPFLVPAALLLMEETVAPRLLRARRATKLGLLSILTIGILFSFSRAAWLNLVVGAIVMFFVLSLRRGGGRRAVTFVVAAVSAAAVLFAALAVTSSFAFLSERARFQTYDVQRFGAQLSGIELAAKYPLGIGPGQFEQISPVSAHSTYVRALSEEGVLGLLVLLALILLTLAFAGRNAVLGRDTYGIGSAALLSAWCGLLANSVFIDTLHWRHLWLLAALIWAGTSRPFAGTRRFQGQSLPSRRSTRSENRERR
jgi:O-antigen ligase/polysaccharide polymerase Wzy-like membrane protein